MAKKSKKVPAVVAQGVVLVDDEASDEEALAEFVEALEELAGKFSDVEFTVSVPLDLDEDEEEEDDEDDDEDEDEDEDDEEDEDEEDDDEDEDDEDDDEDDEDDFWSEDELRSKDLKELQKIAKDYDINPKGKKKGQLIKEILADDEDDDEDF